MAQKGLNSKSRSSSKYQKKKHSRNDEADTLETHEIFRPVTPDPLKQASPQFFRQKLMLAQIQYENEKENMEYFGFETIIDDQDAAGNTKWSSQKVDGTNAVWTTDGGNIYYRDKDGWTTVGETTLDVDGTTLVWSNLENITNLAQEVGTTIVSKNDYQDAVVNITSSIQAPNETTTVDGKDIDGTTVVWTNLENKTNLAQEVGTTMGSENDYQDAVVNITSSIQAPNETTTVDGKDIDGTTVVWTNLENKTNLAQEVGTTMGSENDYQDAVVNITSSIQAHSETTTVDGKAIGNKTKTQDECGGTIIEASSVCPICNKKYHHLRSLQRHSRIHSNKGTNCKVCDKRYFSDYELREHMRKHENVTFLFSVCNKSFKTRGAYNTHKREHNGEFKYFCEQCGNRFNYKSAFLGHMATHNKTKPFSCSKCGKSYQNVSNLSRHVIGCGNDKRRFKCDICGKHFKAKRYLKEHFQCHENPDQYQCAECGSFFKHRSSFYKHRKRTGHK